MNLLAGEGRDKYESGESGVGSRFGVLGVGAVVGLERGLYVRRIVTKILEGVPRLMARTLTLKSVSAPYSYIQLCSSTIQPPISTTSRHPYKKNKYVILSHTGPSCHSKETRMFI